MTHEMERMNLTTLDDEQHNVEEYKATMEMAVARRRRCDAVLAGGEDDRKDDMGKEEKDWLMDFDSLAEIGNIKPDDAHPETEFLSHEMVLKEPKKEEEDFGYYVDMMRGLMNCDIMIPSLNILDGILDLSN